ncbi:hypothetical protein BJX63DRAFT_122811 [Aspergillus granulosus]|uniref:Uncharacterized protein n=1 Tax=Aspergillus granulosus TaxID=176169 RepID=A0ABR4I439_9EURO
MRYCCEGDDGAPGRFPALQIACGWHPVLARRRGEAVAVYVAGVPAALLLRPCPSKLYDSESLLRREIIPSRGAKSTGAFLPLESRHALLPSDSYPNPTPWEIFLTLFADDP